MDNIGRADTWAGQITDKCRDFLKEEDGRPFLLVASYDEPHGPSLCPHPYCSMYEEFYYPYPASFAETFSDKPVHQRLWAENSFYLNDNIKTDPTGLYQPLYFGCASFVDSEIGILLDSLTQEQKDNTIIVFTSDHGHYLGAHRLDTKGPAFYEEVIRIPLIIKMPFACTTGEEEGIVSHLDVLPTLLSVCGLAVPEIMTGNNLADRLVKGRRLPEKDVFIEFNRFSVSRDSWFGLFPIRAVISGSYKLVQNLFSSDELYDLDTDPHEMRNLIKEESYKETGECLRKKVRDHMDAVRDPFRGPVWEKDFNKTGITWESGTRRIRKQDGVLPEACNYDTGCPEN